MRKFGCKKEEINEKTIAIIANAYKNYLRNNEETDKNNAREEYTR